MPIYCPKWLSQWIKILALNFSVLKFLILAILRDVWWLCHLVCFSLMISIFDRISCAYLPSVYLFGKVFKSLVILHDFLVFLFLCLEFVIYSYKLLVLYMICKFFFFLSSLWIVYLLWHSLKCLGKYVLKKSTESRERGWDWETHNQKLFL